ncbi:MAG: hypothetical protein ACK5L5_12325 [Bacteroidales bacterium]
MLEVKVEFKTEDVTEFFERNGYKVEQAEETAYRSAYHNKSEECKEVKYYIEHKRIRLEMMRVFNALAKEMVSCLFFEKIKDGALPQKLDEMLDLD